MKCNDCLWFENTGDAEGDCHASGYEFVKMNEDSFCNKYELADIKGKDCLDCVYFDGGLCSLNPPTTHYDCQDDDTLYRQPEVDDTTVCSKWRD